MSIERLNRPDLDGKNRIITITGVSSSGKNFLSDRVVESESIQNSKLEVFNFGSELLASIVGDLPELEHQGRDKLKNLPTEIIDAYIQKTIRRLIRKQPALQLTHLVFKQENLLNINPQSERTISAVEYIFIEADPGLIYQWRLAELGERQRDIETIDEIRLHQSIALATTKAMAFHFGSGLLKVHNDPLQTENSIDAIASETRTLLL